MSESESKSPDNKTVVNINLNSLTNLITGMIVIIIIAIIVFIIITVFAHKARVKCRRNAKYAFYSTIILVFLLCMWLGGIIPYLGPVLSSAGLIGSIIMIILARINC